MEHRHCGFEVILFLNFQRFILLSVQNFIEVLLGMICSVHATWKDYTLVTRAILHFTCIVQMEDAHVYITKQTWTVSSIIA